MKNYSTLTLKELKTQSKIAYKSLQKEIATSKLLSREPNFVNILTKIQKIKEVTETRGKTPIRDSRPKKLQRQFGILPKV